MSTFTDNEISQSNKDDQISLHTQEEYKGCREFRTDSRTIQVRLTQ